MSYPSFFDEIESIKVKDPLSNVLGAFEMGEYEFGYVDVVKSAGHSCPTVAGAYLMTNKIKRTKTGHTQAIKQKNKFKKNLTNILKN